MWSDIQAWIAQPFNAQMDLQRWVLFVVVILCVIYAWHDVMRHID